MAMTKRIKSWKWCRRRHKDEIEMMDHMECAICDRKFRHFIRTPDGKRWECCVSDPRMISEEGSDNVFADLGFENADEILEEEMAKRALAAADRATEDQERGFQEALDVDRDAYLYIREEYIDAMDEAQRAVAKRYEKAGERDAEARQYGEEQ